MYQPLSSLVVDFSRQGITPGSIVLRRALQASVQTYVNPRDFTLVEVPATPGGKVFHRVQAIARPDCDPNTAAQAAITASKLFQGVPVSLAMGGTILNVTCRDFPRDVLERHRLQIEQREPKVTALKQASQVPTMVEAFQMTQNLPGFTMLRQRRL